MPEQSRIGDMTIGLWDHGQKCCPHTWVGIRVTGSSDVKVNNKGISRAGVDISIHNCPHCGINLCVGGSSNVNANGFPVHRNGDLVCEFCGVGITVTGSPNVFTNEIN